MSSRCLVGVCVLTTQQGITVRSVPRSTMIVPGGLPTAAVGSPTRARVSDHQRDGATVSLPLSSSILILLSLISLAVHASVTSECECHGHADGCHFSQRTWLSSGGTSGGVCDDCRHNTVGRRCHRCRHGYHRHPSLPLNSPHACTRKRHRSEWGSLILTWDVFSISQKPQTKEVS